MFSFIGRPVLMFFEGIGAFFLLLRETVMWTFKKPFDKKNLIHQMIQIGIRSLPIALITTFFTGMVMSMQTALAIESKIKGVSAFIGSGIGFAMVRELGPVMSSVFIAGRVGSAIAAEIGSMKVTDQIDALYTLSTSPVQYLVVPRFLGLVLTLPMVTIFSDYSGILGGALVSSFSLGIPIQTYFNALKLAVGFGDILHGLIKSVCFAIIIVIIACRQGFLTSGGAEGVGESTTRTVVYASIAILISDYFLTLFLRYTLGI